MQRKTTNLRFSFAALCFVPDEVLAQPFALRHFKRSSLVLRHLRINAV
jgi:hypothetical protein